MDEHADNAESSRMFTITEILIPVVGSSKTVRQRKWVWRQIGLGYFTENILYQHKSKRKKVQTS
jgi:hypothetical protein